MVQSLSPKKDRRLKLDLLKAKAVYLFNNALVKTGVIGAVAMAPLVILVPQMGGSAGLYIGLTAMMGGFVSSAVLAGQGRALSLKNITELSQQIARGEGLSATAGKESTLDAAARLLKNKAPLKNKKGGPSLNL